MVRPRKPRFIRNNPEVYYFKPQGIPLRQLEEIVIFADEFEAIRLHDQQDLPQIQAAEKMQISQPTFARILSRAHQKIAQAIINGYAIRIEQKI